MSRGGKRLKKGEEMRKEVEEKDLEVMRKEMKWGEEKQEKKKLEGDDRFLGWRRKKLNKRWKRLKSNKESIN